MISIDAARAAIAILGFGIIVYGPWQVACNEWSRQTMFMQRDKLFEIARSGRLAFQSPAYLKHFHHDRARHDDKNACKIRARAFSVMLKKPYMQGIASICSSG